jgi:hypothetical protein
VNERPSPVQSATYAARHTGHFGMSTHTPSDSAPAAISQALRDRCELEVGRAAWDDGSGPPPWQQQPGKDRPSRGRGHSFYADQEGG